MSPHKLLFKEQILFVVLYLMLFIVFLPHLHTLSLSLCHSANCLALVIAHTHVCIINYYLFSILEYFYNNNNTTTTTATTNTTTKKSNVKRKRAREEEPSFNLFKCCQYWYSECVLLKIRFLSGSGFLFAIFVHRMSILGQLFEVA